MGCAYYPLGLMESSAGWPLVSERWGWRGPGRPGGLPPSSHPGGVPGAKPSLCSPKSGRPGHGATPHLPTQPPAVRQGAPSNLGTPLAPGLPPPTDCAEAGAGWPQQTYLSSTDHKPSHGDGAGALYRVRSAEEKRGGGGGGGQLGPAISSALGGQLTRRKPEARAGRLNLGSAVRPPPALGRASRR